MRKILFTRLVLLTLTTAPLLANAVQQNKLYSPVKGVVCDVYICAESTGVSVTLTAKYLGEKKGAQLAAQGEFDRTVFTFANGISCDTREKVCRKDRYFSTDGKPSGVIDNLTTQLLFPQ